MPGHLVELKAGPGPGPWPHPHPGPPMKREGGRKQDWQIEMNVSIHLEMFIKRHSPFQGSVGGRRHHKTEQDAGTLWRLTSNDRHMIA